MTASIKRCILLPCLFIMITSCGTEEPLSQYEVENVAYSPTPPVSTREILNYINQYRERRGLPALKMNNSISAAAERHSRDMADKEIPFGHSGFDGRMHHLMQELAPANAAAENVAYGNISARQVVNLWIQSPGHRKNILGNYNLTGIGIASDRHGTLYFTQIFINKR